MANGRYTRSAASSTPIYDGGPYEAIVVNHLDTTYMGNLEVEILRYTGAGSSPERSGQLLNVKYLSPFYGVTPTVGLQANDGYENTQKSYGMWMVPPDIGTKVLVIFAEGNPNFGYWIGCIQDDFMNFMIPDGRAVTERTTEITPNNLKGNKLPVGEYNKRTEDGSLIDPTIFNKPYNKDFTNVLEVQGLLNDETRGQTTSSARREIPSMVFGFSTPGPLDKRAGSPRVDIGTSGKKANVAYNRLGGSSLVMDDGNDKYVRKTHAEDGPPLYVNKLKSEAGGDETIPHNELVRLRTRTGHQILLHNSEDLIYIANSRGTAWIELTSDGKIDIHAQDSISIMSDNDINFTAERDFNIEAGRNINLSATARWSDGQKTFDGLESGRVHIESQFDTKIHVGNDYKITVVGESDTVVNKNMKTTVKQNLDFHTNQNYHLLADAGIHEKSKHSFYRESESNINDLSRGLHFIKTAGFNLHTNGGAGGDGDARFLISGNMEGIIQGYRHESVTGEVHLISDSNIRHQSADEYVVISAQDIHHSAAAAHHVIAGQSSYHTTGSNVNIQAAGVIAGDAGEIHWNSGLSGGAAPGGDPVVAISALSASKSTPPRDATPIEPLPTITLPYMFPGAQQPVPYESILTRAPQHEPWMHHENMNPMGFKKEETDREQPGPLVPVDRVLTPDIFNKERAAVTSSRTVTGSSGNPTDFDGGTGDGRANSEPNAAPRSEATFDPTGEEGKLVEVFARRAGLSCQVAEVFAPNFQAFLDEFEATGYEIKLLGGYSYRRAVGSRSWSCHASGAAIDINWPNPVHNTYPNGFYSPRPADAPMTDMPANTLEIANKHGLGWGGAWRSLDDAMHFSAHTSEGGSFTFPRNGRIPKGPSNATDLQNPHPDEDRGNDLDDPADQDNTNLPGNQNSDGSPNSGAQ
jgi:uncharacterized protein (DUF2345 family)